MAKNAPQMPISRTTSFDGSLSVKDAVSFEDTVSVKDSTVYQIQKWKYLVKKQTIRNGGDELLVWLEEFASQGWELISSQSAVLGFYIFKKPSK